MSPRRARSDVSSVLEGQRADYLAAKHDPRQRRRSGLPSMGAGADWHFKSEGELLRIRELSRDMDRNDMLIGQAFDRATDITVGTGFGADPKTGSEKLDDALRARWEAWSTDPDACDLAKEQTFKGLERLVLRQTLVDGDVIPVGTTNGSIEIVEAHRCQTPTSTSRNVVHGVLLDKMTRERLEYWFTKEPVGSGRQASLVRDMRQVPTRNPAGRRQVFHVYNPKRVSQTRGVPAIIPAIAAAGYFEDLHYTNLVRQQIACAFGLVRELSENDLGEGEADDGPGYVAAGGDPERPGFEPGMEYTGRPGEKLSVFSANIPNTEFFQQMKTMAEVIGLNLGLPLIVLTMDASQTNFSGWRGAFELAKYGWRRNQEWLRDRFHREVWRWKVRHWLATDKSLRILADADGVDPFAHDWKFPAWPYIDPMKDAQADALLIDKMLSSRRRVAQRSGIDFDILAPEAIADNAKIVRLAIEAANELNKDNPAAEINWRELVGSVAGVANASPSDSGGDDASKPTGDER